MVDTAIERAVRRLAAVGKAYPREEGPRFEPPASATELAELEAAVGGPLPRELADLLRTSRAIWALDIRNGYAIGGPGALARSIRRHDFPAQLEVRGQAARAIPVATDGGGNAFLLSADGSIWRWDHETGSRTSVAGNLEEFLDRVAQDWSHDLEGDQSWTYLV